MIRNFDDNDLPRVAIDTETTGINVWTGCRPYMVTMAWEDGATACWEWRIDPFTRIPIVPLKDKKEIREITLDPKLVKVFWNLKFDVNMLRAVNIPVEGPWAEATFKARAVNNLEFSYALKPLSKKYLQFDDGDQNDLHKATVSARRVAKKLGWMVATKASHGTTPVPGDYWICEELWKREPKLAKDAEIPRGLCEIYGVQDALRTLQLDEFLDFGLREEEKNDPRQNAKGVDLSMLQAMDSIGVYRREMLLLPLTMEMEHVGVRVDGKKLKECAKQCKRDLKLATEYLKKASGREDFNHNSPQQVGQFVFGMGGKNLGLPILGKTKTGQPKTDGEHLMPHKSKPAVDAILRARANEKALSTFFQKYQNLADIQIIKRKGFPTRKQMILHPGYHQWGTLTGRYTCTAPNLQQVSDPTNTNSRMAEFVVDVRQVFVPRHGKVWYCPDYDQVEVIVFADIAGEEVMLNAITSGIDIHTATCNKIWGGVDNPKMPVCVDRVLRTMNHPRAGDDGFVMDTIKKFNGDLVELEKSFGAKLWRKIGKGVTFTKIFGGGCAALMGWIDCDRAESMRLLREYEEEFPNMQTSFLNIERIATKCGFVVNRYGRKLMIDRWYAYRATNYLVQSAAADLLKDGMRKCADYLKETGLDAKIIMTVHDELVFEFRKEDAFKSVLRKLCDLMSDHGGRFSVPTPVSMDRVTERWSKKEKVTL